MSAFQRLRTAALILIMKKSFFTLLLLTAINKIYSQDSSLLKMLNSSLEQEQTNTLVTGTFKAAQIINTPTIESPGKKNLQFLIMHRFGKLNEGSYALFGLDNATIRFGLDYGITNRLSVGIGRSSLDKTFDGSVKYKVLQQKLQGMPISFSIYELISHYTQKYTDKSFLNSKYRTSYTSAFLIARKFSSALSLEFVPSWTHFNLVPTPKDKNDVFAVTAGGRLKFTRRMSLNAEYNYLFPNQVVSYKVHNSLSLGIDIETGGHVFQLVFSNSQGMIAPWYLAKTDGSWGKGDIFFGFNISRNFSFNRKNDKTGNQKKW